MTDGQAKVVQRLLEDLKDVVGEQGKAPKRGPRRWRELDQEFRDVGDSLEVLASFSEREKSGRPDVEDVEDTILAAAEMIKELDIAIDSADQESEERFVKEVNKEVLAHGIDIMARRASEVLEISKTLGEAPKEMKGLLRELEKVKSQRGSDNFRQNWKAFEVVGALIEAEAAVDHNVLDPDWVTVLEYTVFDVVAKGLAAMGDRASGIRPPLPSKGGETSFLGKLGGLLR